MTDLFEPIKEIKKACHISRIFVDYVELESLPTKYDIKWLFLAEDKELDLYIIDNRVYFWKTN